MHLATLIVAALVVQSELDDRTRRIALSMSPVPPPPASPTNAWADDEAAARLGRLLFFDTGLSRTGAVSCATCHDPDRGFTDGRTVAMAVGEGTRNTPTVLGAGHQRWLFWDGRTDTAWSQATHPFETDVEMDGSRVDMARHIAATPALARAWSDVFGAPPDFTDLDRFPLGARPGTEGWDAMTSEDRQHATLVLVHVGKAIEAYERQLQPGTSDFDRWVEQVRAGDPGDAMPPEAIRGFELFIGDAGCRQCHFGPLFTDREFHDIGVPAHGGGLDDDPGRGAVRAVLDANPFRAGGPWSDDPDGVHARRSARVRIGPEHWGAFRTPSLRNVGLTGPYMHGGQIETLEDVVSFYDTLETQARRHAHGENVLVPLNLTTRQRADLVAFLTALTGDPPPPQWREPASVDDSTGTKAGSSIE